MGKKQFTNINNAEIASKGVIALADKPNVASSYGVGSLNATQLKLWFDKLGTLLASKINAIQTALKDEGQDYISVNNLGAEIECLKDLTASFLDGSFATLLLAYENVADSTNVENLKPLQTIINGIAQSIADTIEDVADRYTKTEADSLLANKVDKVNGSQLISEGELEKLGRIADGAEVNVQSDWNQTNNTADDFIKNKPTSLPASDVYLWAKANAKPTYSYAEITGTKPTYTASEVGLGNVDNTSDLDKPISTAVQTALNGKASLDVNHKVPISQLPSYVDDVEEYQTTTLFPATGETGKIYVVTNTNKTYRWSGSGYVEISQSLAIGTTASTAAAGNHTHANYSLTTHTHTYDQTYSATSTNAQSGVAVAQAIASAITTALNTGV